MYERKHDFAPKTTPIQGVEERKKMYRTIDPEGPWEPEPTPHGFAPKKPFMEGMEERRKEFQMFDSEEWEPEPEVKIDTDFTNGVKFDAEKPMAGILLDFRRTLWQVAELGTFGAKKYERSNWLKVDRIRYLDAAMRHILQEGDDPETGLPHLVSAIWNLMAYQELLLRGKENE